jgi:hypothetical protein
VLCALREAKAADVSAAGHAFVWLDLPAGIAGQQSEIEVTDLRQYAQEAQTREAMKNHMYVIADALANGIEEQFPDKFR